MRVRESGGRSRLRTPSYPAPSPPRPPPPRLYGFRVPERFMPGRLDSFNSHAIWHLFVVAAASTHYFAALTHRNWRGRFLECDAR